MQEKCANISVNTSNVRDFAYMQDISKNVPWSPLHREIEERSSFTNRELEDLYHDAWQRGYDSRKEEELREHNRTVENYSSDHKTYGNGLIYGV